VDINLWKNKRTGKSGSAPFLSRPFLKTDLLFSGIERENEYRIYIKFRQLMAASASGDPVPDGVS
jgi:hypothetical protein